MTASTVLSLSEEQRARARILLAARRVLAEEGLATRVDDVAEAAGVGRRTVFRHFETNDALLAAALTDSMRSYGEHIPQPTPGASLDEWLEEALVAVHRMNARHGRIYWELPSRLTSSASWPTRPRPGGSSCAGSPTGRGRRAAAAAVRPSGWQTPSPCTLSAFATQALVGDFGRPPEEAGRVAARVLSAAVERAVTER